MPIPDNQKQYIEVATLGRMASGGSNTVNVAQVYHFRRTSLAPAISKGHIDTAFQAAIVVPLGAALNNRYLQISNNIRYIDDALDAPISFAHAVAGSIAGDSMASFNSAFVYMGTGLRGKSYRGSKKIGPMSESDTTGANSDVFNAGALVNLNAFAAALLAGFVDADGNAWIPCIVSKKLSTLNVNPTFIVSADTLVVRVNKRVGRMRRREAKSVY